ncbi:MAG: tRNA threonylcarbamoyladenosine dehydratase [Eubacterium sp.]|nr:tRNA threonylcarbamoyladenosine dehydratase [Eubacterium sp.]
MDQFARTALLYGSEAMERLKNSRVAVFGVGGVGGYVVEALVRSGVGALDIVDNDTVSLTNLNRQIIALHSTIGQSKTAVMQARIADISPECRVVAHTLFFSEETKEQFDFSQYDYVVDAIDSVKSKLLLAELCTAQGVPLIASMGTGNKTDPTQFCITDISKTAYDPLARVMRYELRKRGIRHLTVLCSTEQPKKPAAEQVQAVQAQENSKGRTVPASNAFVPPAAGLIIASRVINDLTGTNDGKRITTASAD